MTMHIGNCARPPGASLFQPVLAPPTGNGARTSLAGCGPVSGAAVSGAAVSGGLVSGGLVSRGTSRDQQ